MSAYMVDDNTINKIIATLYNKVRVSEYYWSAEPLKNAGYDLRKKEDRQRLAIRMYALNRRSIRERYSREAAKMDTQAGFTFQDTMPVSLVQTYKSIQCWKYQACEGTCDQASLYKLMSEVSNRLAHEIVTKSESYEKATWG